MYSNDNWPKRRDGTNKTLGEMTLEEQDGVFELARRRLVARGDYGKAVVTAAISQVCHSLKREGVS